MSRSTKVTLKTIPKLKSYSKLSFSGKQRFNRFFKRINYTVDLIHYALDEMGDNKPLQKEMLRHIPTALVSILQGCIKALLCSLIDYDNKLALKLEHIHKIDFDIGAMIEIRKKQMTLGHVVASTIPLNSINNIYNLFDALLSPDFKKHFDNVDTSFYNKTRPKLCDNRKKLHTTVEKMFRERHSLCHELDPPWYFSRTKLINMAQMTYLLMTAIEETVFKYMEKNY